MSTTLSITPYPGRPNERTRWITDARGPKNLMDSGRAYATLSEEEVGPCGTLVHTSTLFLTNRECPWRCLMCDLWQNTLDTRVPVGAIPEQIRSALANLSPARQIKLYNAGSFFDNQAIPPEDDAAIAELLQPFERVIVECHPSLIGERCLQFRDRLSGKLEVAIGLETAHPSVLEKLNKRITVDSFLKAAEFLAQNAIDLRVFLLLKPPFMSDAEGVEWARRSLDVGFEAGATVCSVIPTRGGNGAMERLAESGDWSPPNLQDLESVQEYGLALQKGRVFADLWDIERFFTCGCSPSRAARIGHMNQTQRIPASIHCNSCGSRGIA